MLNSITNQLDFDKIYLYAKDPYEAKYQLFINKKESPGLMCFNGSESFIEYLNDMDDIYKNIEENNLNKKRKIWIVFDDLIANVATNKKPNPMVTELLIREGKLNISLVFVIQSYFAVPENIRLNSTHYFIMKILNRRELQQIALGIDFQDFMNLYKKRTTNPYSFLVTDTTLT